jgi:hypothetical protein
MNKQTLTKGRHGQNDELDIVDMVLLKKKCNTGK